MLATAIGVSFHAFVLIFDSPRRFYLTGDMTNSFNLSKVRWNDHIVNYIPLMYCYGINTNILHLTFSRAEV